MGHTDNNTKMSSPDSDPGDTVTEGSNTEDYTDVSTENSDGEDSEIAIPVTHHSDGASNLVDPVPAIAITSKPRNKVTKSMQDILKEMVKQKKLLEEHEMLLAFSAEDIDNVYENNTAVDLFGEPIDDLKLFASFLHYYAPEAYEYILENYNTPLPSIKELGSWCENDKFQAGFTKQAFDILHKRSAEKGRPLICSLVGDSYQLFVRDSFVSIDVGAGPLEGDYADEIEGRHAYVMLLVSLEENWKIPLGYFLIDQTCTQTKANLIKMCLYRCHEIGVDVVSVTTTTNVAQVLGCEFADYKKLKTTFNHPATSTPVAVFIDPSLSLRSLYMTLSSKKELYNGQKGKICMEFIEQLKKILANKAFQFDFSTNLLDLRNILAKIDLISELMMPSVAAGLEICKNRLMHTNFANAGPTIEYLTMINTLYYILYSKVGQTGYKQPICQENGKEILEFLEEAKKFISSISYANPGMSRQRTQLAVQDSNFRTEGFKGLLISVETLKHLYKTLVEKELLTSLPTYRLSWDQMDEFLGVILKHDPRQRGGRFPPLYQRFFEDLKYTLTDSIQIESYGITNQKKALNIIKKSSGKRAFDELFSVVGNKRLKTEDEKRADVTVAKFVKHLDKEQDQTDRRQMVSYVAGWIAVALAKTLRCEDCIDALLSNEKLWFHKYITMKELKGVCLPSEELFRICWECERSIRGQTKLDTAAQRRLLSRALHIPKVKHRGHHIHLAKAVIAKYVRIRMGIDDTQKQKKPKSNNFNFMLNFLMFGM